MAAPIFTSVADGETLRILLATDCHLGYAERDGIRTDDSFRTVRPGVRWEGVALAVLARVQPFTPHICAPVSVRGDHADRPGQFRRLRVARG